MEQLYAGLLGIVSQALTAGAIKYLKLEGGEKATMNSIITFASVILTLGIMELAGYHYDPTTPASIQFGGLVFTSSQLTFYLHRYVWPRVSEAFLALLAGLKSRK